MRRGRAAEASGGGWSAVKGGDRARPEGKQDNNVYHTGGFLLLTMSS